jgi:hypothetical protein
MVGSKKDSNQKEAKNTRARRLLRFAANFH